MKLHIGMDDTDSPRGGCTTYIAALLVDGLTTLGAKFLDYPTLLRLNPNAPWKTRGNASVCLRVEVEPEREGQIKELVLDAVDEYGEFWCDDTNPGIVFHMGELPEPLKAFSDRVVRSIVSLDEAEGLIDEHCAGAMGFKNRRGLIGALAAVGGSLEGDHTYELLAYRTPDNWGDERRVDAESVRAMDASMGGATFSNIDSETRRPLITPHGPDPVLYGVRGETPEAVHRASSMLSLSEPVERWLIYRSNQGTDAHLANNHKINELKPHHPATIHCQVSSCPETIRGGHVIIRVGDETGTVDCAAYEPTGGFREVVRGLIPGDGVRAAGGVRPLDDGFTLNLERLDILSLAVDVVRVNPRCPDCGAGMESMGRGKGFRCRKCGLRDSDGYKLEVERPRRVKPGLYLPPKRAHRHLTKPLERYGREKRHVSRPLYCPWHWP